MIFLTIFATITKGFNYLISIFSGKTNYDVARLLTIILLLGVLLFSFLYVKSCVNDYSIRQKTKEELKINNNINSAQTNITILEVEANSIKNTRENINSNINNLNKQIENSQRNISNIQNRNNSVSGRDLDEKANRIY